MVSPRRLEGTTPPWMFPGRKVLCQRALQPQDADTEFQAMSSGPLSSRHALRENTTERSQSPGEDNTRGHDWRKNVNSEDGAEEAKGSEEEEKGRNEEDEVHQTPGPTQARPRADQKQPHICRQLPVATAAWRPGAQQPRRHTTGTRHRELCPRLGDEPSYRNSCHYTQHKPL